MELTWAPPDWRFWKTAGEEPSRVGETATDRTDAVSRQRKRALVCLQCGAAIASPEARIEVKGAHEHAFFNPHGVIFRIGCFNEAPGCAPVGQASAEFSWFPGRLWRVAHCRGCQAHLGWSFLCADAPAFYGLILDRLTERTIDSTDPS